MTSHITSCIVYFIRFFYANISRENHLIDGVFNTIFNDHLDVAYCG